ncbi:MAG: hypothetical protein ACMV0I_00950 [Pseudomonas sp.]
MNKTQKNHKQNPKKTIKTVDSDRNPVKYTPIPRHDGADREGSTMKFIVKEAHNANFDLNTISAYEIEAKDLAGAKRAASRAQQFKGTLLAIADYAGSIISVKDGGKWQAA